MWNIENLRQSVSKRNEPRKQSIQRAYGRMIWLLVTFTVEDITIGLIQNVALCHDLWHPRRTPLLHQVQSLQSVPLDSSKDTCVSVFDLEARFNLQASNQSCNRRPPKYRNCQR